MEKWKIFSKIQSFSIKWKQGIDHENPKNKFHYYPSFLCSFQRNFRIILSCWYRLLEIIISLFIMIIYGALFDNNIIKTECRLYASYENSYHQFAVVCSFSFSKNIIKIAYYVTEMYIILLSRRIPTRHNSFISKK